MNYFIISYRNWISFIYNDGSIKLQILRYNATRAVKFFKLIADKSFLGADKDIEKNFKLRNKMVAK